MTTPDPRRGQPPVRRAGTAPTGATPVPGAALDRGVPPLASVQAAEEWRPIPGLDGRYEVSDQGRVRSNVRAVGRVMKTSPDRHGYLAVKVSRFGETKTYRVHSLVALAFIGPRPDGLLVRHLDDVKLNNVPSNLAYGTVSQNALDAVRLGTHPCTKRTHCAQGHPYDEVNTYPRPSGGRDCRACMAARTVRLRAARRAS